MAEDGANDFAKAVRRSNREFHQEWAIDVDQDGTVVWKHALKVAFLPVLSFLGPATAQAMTGSFVVEKVFGVPGLGQHFVNAALNLDAGLIMSTVLVRVLVLAAL